MDVMGGAKNEHSPTTTNHSAQMDMVGGAKHEYSPTTTTHIAKQHNNQPMTEHMTGQKNTQ